MHVTAFSPLGSAGYVEMGWTKPTEGAINEPCVKAAAEAHGVTPGQVLLRWAVQRGTSAIPKTSKPERLSENIDVFARRFGSPRRRWPPSTRSTATTGTTTRPSFVRAWADRAHLPLRTQRELSSADYLSS